MPLSLYYQLKRFILKLFFGRPNSASQLLRKDAFTLYDRAAKEFLTYAEAKVKKSYWTKFQDADLQQCLFAGADILSTRTVKLIIGIDHSLLQHGTEQVVGPDAENIEALKIDFLEEACNTISGQLKGDIGFLAEITLPKQLSDSDLSLISNPRVYVAETPQGNLTIFTRLMPTH